MTKRLVDIDDEDLAAARAALGGELTIKDTVGRALREVTAAAARRREVLRLTEGPAQALADPEGRAQAWQ